MIFFLHFFYFDEHFFINSIYFYTDCPYDPIISAILSYFRSFETMFFQVTIEGDIRGLLSSPSPRFKSKV